MYFSVVCDCAFCCEEARLTDQFLFADWGRGGWWGGVELVGWGGVRERG